MGKAACLFGLFAVPRAGEVRPLAANQSGPLFGFRLFGRNAAQSSSPDLFSRFSRNAMMANRFGVAVRKMLPRRQTFQVFRSIVGFNAVDVVDVLFGAKRLQPASRYNPVHKVVTATERQVPVFSQGRAVRLELSENFSAARNGKKVVKESVLDSVYFYAQHAVPLKVAKESGF